MLDNLEIINGSSFWFLSSNVRLAFSLVLEEQCKYQSVIKGSFERHVGGCLFRASDWLDLVPLDKIKGGLLHDL